MERKEDGYNDEKNISADFVRLLLVVGKFEINVSYQENIEGFAHKQFKNKTKLFHTS